MFLHFVERRRLAAQCLPPAIAHACLAESMSTRYSLESSRADLAHGAGCERLQGGRKLTSRDFHDVVSLTFRRCTILATGYLQNCTGARSSVGKKVGSQTFPAFRKRSTEFRGLHVRHSLSLLGVTCGYVLYARTQDRAAKKYGRMPGPEGERAAWKTELAAS